jgi:hypothetical protein
VERATRRAGLIGNAAEDEAMTEMIELLIYIAIISLVAWVLTQLVPMPGAVRTALIAVAILLILPVVLRTLGGVDVALGAEQTQAALWSGGFVAPWCRFALEEKSRSNIENYCPSLACIQV